MVSPVDLPKLEEIHCPESTTIGSNKDISQGIMIEESQNSNDQKYNLEIPEIGKPNSININQSTSPSVRRKISTPDFEEEERQLMMEEDSPKKKDTNLKSEPFKLDFNSLNLGFEDGSRKYFKEQPNVTEHAFSQKEKVDSLPGALYLSKDAFIFLFIIEYPPFLLVIGMGIPSVITFSISSIYVVFLL